uniref:Secreted protein n=1 Tax=Steinernema glaseri TaxID=37863 RepID=A0A1I7YHJ3_9BILA
MKLQVRRSVKSLPLSLSWLSIAHCGYYVLKTVSGWRQLCFRMTTCHQKPRNAFWQVDSEGSQIPCPISPLASLEIQSTYFWAPATTREMCAGIRRL